MFSKNVRYNLNNIEKANFSKSSQYPTAHLKNLLNHHLRYVNKDFDIIAIASSGKEMATIENISGVTTTAIEMTRTISPISDIRAIYQMYRFFLEKKPSIIHSHTPKAGLIAMLSGWLAGVPIRMHTVAGLQFESKKET